MPQITLVFISLSGNTLSFVKRLSLYLADNYDYHVKQINIKDLKHEAFPVKEEFVAILPTYLEGGNGVDSGEVEILTTPLGEFIAAHGNAQRCLGII
ncbi:TPA: class Ib ribonucleoside-diphosphate reductase assembly flavoprotein NrdI, partial [Streptococcus pyogenes]|nr:class Ib ribonucleoside-diphosphate reductase assembly flavoprotein NrdI [Streptococcus pyogenes]